MFGVNSVFLTIHPSGIITLYGAFNTATSTLGVVGLPLAILSNRNIFFLLHDMCNKIILGNASFLLKMSSPRNYVMIYMDTLLSAIQHADLLSLTILYQWFSSWRLIFYPLHLNFDRSLNTALSWYVQQALCLLLPSLPHWFIFTLGLVIFEHKGHIYKVYQCNVLIVCIGIFFGFFLSLYLAIVTMEICCLESCIGIVRSHGGPVW